MRSVTQDEPPKAHTIPCATDHDDDCCVLAQVRATGGNTRLGGEDIDATTAAWVLQSFTKANPKVQVTERSMRRLYAAVERAKRQLSSAGGATPLI